MVLSCILIAIRPMATGSHAGRHEDLGACRGQEFLRRRTKTATALPTAKAMARATRATRAVALSAAGVLIAVASGLSWPSAPRRMSRVGSAGGSAAGSAAARRVLVGEVSADPATAPGRSERAASAAGAVLAVARGALYSAGGAPACRLAGSALPVEDGTRELLLAISGVGALVSGARPEVGVHVMGVAGVREAGVLAPDLFVAFVLLWSLSAGLFAGALFVAAFFVAAV